MASFSLTKHIMGEKPHSSITDWVEILSGDRYKENDLDGIPELVDSINLQAEGPNEASRAIRKKLKYGNIHRQLRALTILKALTENCGPKFQLSLAHNEMLTSRLKILAQNPLTDELVKKKLMGVLGSWHRQFKDDPKMAPVAGLWTSVGGGIRSRPPPPPPPQANADWEEQSRVRAEQKAKERASKEEEKRLEKERKDKEREKRKAPVKGKTARKPFEFEKEKPQIFASIANASQASIQLSNALKLVNREQESIQDNAHVQECLANAKAARKAVVRYIQLVENEELIGTLLDTNERIITSLQLYDHLLKSADHDSDDAAEAQEQLNQAKLASLSLTSSLSPPGEISKLQGKQRAEIQRSLSRSSLNVNSRGISRPPMSGGDLDLAGGGANVHPDLKDLNWGSLGDDVDGAKALPPPIRPTGATEEYGQASLSDYSDYDSSDDGGPSTAPTSYGAGPSSSGHRDYEAFVGRGGQGKVALMDEDDPFADPFADGASILTASDDEGTANKKSWQ